MMPLVRHALVPCCLAVTLWLVGCGAPAASAPSEQRDTISRLPNHELSNVAETDPADIFPQTHLAAGRLHESQNRLSRAAQQYRRAIAIQPDYVEALNRLGIVLDRQANENARGEAKISTAKSRTQIWVVPANEELIVARQAKLLLEG